MAVLPAIFRRDDGVATDETTATYSPTMEKVVTAVVALMLVGLLLTGALFYVRQRRKRAAAQRLQSQLIDSMPSTPAYKPAMQQHGQQRNMSLRAPSRPSHHRRNKSLTTPPESPLFTVGEHDHDSDSDSLLDEKRYEAGVVPQIHLTFPEELDEKTGRRESKVVVVTVTDKGSVGLEPFSVDATTVAPPAYSAREDMKSLDLERIGGLREVKN